MKKIGMLAFAVMILFAFGCKEKSLKIGFVGPLTGNAGNYGKLMTQAIRIAVDEKNAAGGINGVKIEFIAEDDEGKPDKASAAFEKLAGVDRVYGIVGAVFSSCSLAIAPRAQSEKIVMISPSSTVKGLTEGKDFVFRDVLSDELQAKVFANYTREILKLNKVAILHIKNDYSQGLADDFKAQFESLGGQITAVESGLQDDKDFKTQLTKIKGSSPEALYIPNYIAEIAQILEQAKQLGLNVKILSADGYSNPEIFKLAGELANGVIFSNSADESVLGSNPLRAEFEDKYEARWKEKPDAFSLNSYDAARIIIDALEKAYMAGTDEQQKNLLLDRDKIREYAALTAAYEGVSGKITFLPSGDAIKKVGIFIAENGAYRQTAVYQLTSDGKLEEVK